MRPLFGSSMQQVLSVNIKMEKSVSGERLKAIRTRKFPLTKKLCYRAIKFYQTEPPRTILLLWCFDFAPRAV
jgi:hypothetical protein